MSRVTINVVVETEGDDAAAGRALDVVYEAAKRMLEEHDAVDINLEVNPKPFEPRIEVSGPSTPHWWTAPSPPSIYGPGVVSSASSSVHGGDPSEPPHMITGRIGVSLIAERDGETEAVLPLKTRAKKTKGQLVAEFDAEYEKGDDADTAKLTNLAGEIGRLG